MENKLNVTIVQSNLIWENIEANLEMFSKKLEKIEQTDIIVLPEMFNTGFSMNSKYLAEKPNGKTLKWLLEQSKKLQSAIVTSIIIEENEKYYNRLFWIEPNGKILHYNKRHLFRMANEQNFYTAGTESIIINYKGWRIKPLICYDLRFPIWSRNKQDYDLLIYVANWPERRAKPWKILLKARAIENQSYVVGVNRVGTDGNNIVFSGNSIVIDAYGNKISKTKPHIENSEKITLNMNKLIEFRKKFPVHLDADNFQIQL